MSSTQSNFETLQKEAELLPGNLIQALAQRDGPNEGGLTLAREHIVTLNQYANHVFALPVAKDAVIRWLGYSTITEPALMPDKMVNLNKRLQSHGRNWTTLSDVSKKLGFELASSANNINSSGNDVLEILEQSKALGKRKEEWESIHFNKPIALVADDKRRVMNLVDYMEVLREDVDIFARRVGDVRTETERFRDEAREQLIPLVIEKAEAVGRRQASGEVDKLRGDLASLDKDIKRLEGEYDQYLKAALSGLAAGPLALVITGSIYGAKAEKVRKERNKRQQERSQVSQKLKAAIRLEGLMEELKTRMGQLDARLRDVVTASSHLQSAWQLIGVYIDASIEHLERIETNQQLFKFAIFFKRFIDQWKDIEKFAQHMNRVFDDSASSK